MALGINIRMLQAYLILLAAVAVYIIFAKGKSLKRFIAGLISVIIMAVVSGLGCGGRSDARS
jgi:4-amino-4-deoxy-L-arabinose transferase-like glycosyltransferase